MADEKAVGAGAGAAQGAAAGAAVAGPYGAVIGAVVGGAIGYFSGAEKKLAKKYGRKAQETRRRQQQMQAAIQRRDVVRQSRIARANAIAAGTSEGGVTSSAVQGASSSITAQTESALTYFDRQIGLDNLFQTYAKKAGKHAGNAAALDSLLGAAGDLAITGANAYGALNTGSSKPQYGSFNNTAAQYNMANNSAFTSYGVGLNL